MKKLQLFSFVICCSILFLACSENTTKQTDQEATPGKLSTDLVHNPGSLQEDTNSSLDVAIMTFTDTVHDFGRIKEGEIVQYDFNFKNTGKRNLIINDAKGSCGCTIPKYPTEPIQAGAQNIIHVTFDSKGKKGYNEKGVVVITNGKPSVSNLTILAEVY
jgi:hypothetical protein